ncbi:hypothetical protein [Streptomyces sp. NPDC002537]
MNMQGMGQGHTWPMVPVKKPRHGLTRPGNGSWGEKYAVLPTQLCKAHHLLPLERNIFAADLTTTKVAQLTVPEEHR